MERIQQDGVPAPARPTWMARLWPLSNGPSEIRCLDGLRAVAALSVLCLHAWHAAGDQAPTIFGLHVDFLWAYGETGVHLFFVLSGFLLFLPYARALLASRPLPSARRFYYRRALRILPAYYVCLAVLALLQWPQFDSVTGLADIASHLVFLHDIVSSFNRAIEGPFWTLAVEVQFYLLLPLMALYLQRVMGRSSSLRRLSIGILSLIAFALALRELDAAVRASLPALCHPGRIAALSVVHLTLGGQGKYIEVFALGMLCSACYVAVSERGALADRARTWVGFALFAGGLAGAYLLALWVHGTSYDVPAEQIVSQPANVGVVYGPFLVGASYAALVLGVVWGVSGVRRVFEFPVLRFIGLISFSLYLWHQPIIFALAPFSTRLPGIPPVIGALGVGLAVALVVAYVSYQVVERPFLRRRHGTRVATAAQAAVIAPQVAYADLVRVSSRTMGHVTEPEA